MGYLLVVIEQFLMRLGASTFASVATRVAALTSSVPAKSVPALLASIKNFVGNNVGKFNMVLSVLAAAGMTIDWGAVTSSEPGLIPYVDNFKAIVNQASSELAGRNIEARHQHTGDGKDNQSDDGPLAEAIAAKRVIQRAALSCGSVNGLIALRDAIFMDETDFMRGLALLKA
jgi:hypothetical protein